nr:EOG090X0B4J [Eubosmina coregoni]
MNGYKPEDWELDDIVRNIKWAAQQRVDNSNRMKLRHRLMEDDLMPLSEEEEAAAREYDYILQQQYQQLAEQMNNNRANNNNNKNKMAAENKMPDESVEEKKPHRPFAYRPSEAGYYDTNIGVRPQQQQQTHQQLANPIIQSVPIDAAPVVAEVEDINNNHDIRSLGQKEDIFGDLDQEDKKQETKVGTGAGKFANDETDRINKQLAPAVATEEAISREPIAHAIIQPANGSQGTHDSMADIYLTALVAGCTASAVAAILALGVCFYRWQRRSKAAQDVEYPAYGITGPGPSSGKSSLKSSPSTSTAPGGGWGTSPGKTSAAAAASSGDKKLAHSAHMFHFQHQKQQVIAMESSHTGCERRGSNSGAESDEDNEEGDYTVYECPGLAPTGEMEVKNPLFLDDPTPATPAAVKRQSK